MVEEEKKGSIELPDGVPADFNMEDENALTEFIDDAAFNVFVDSIGEAFVNDIDT